MKIIIDQYELEIQARNVNLSDELNDDGAKYFLNDMAVYLMMGSTAAKAAGIKQLLNRKVIKIIDALSSIGFYDSLRASREEAQDNE